MPRTALRNRNGFKKKELNMNGKYDMINTICYEHNACVTEGKVLQVHVKKCVQVGKSILGRRGYIAFFQKDIKS